MKKYNEHFIGILIYKLRFKMLSLNNNLREYPYMANKHPGTCPHCRTTVTPIILEENFVRRDKCQCTNPKCLGIVYACRSPGCDHYAKGGNAWDEELCPACTKGMSESAKPIIEKAAVVIAGLAVTAAVAKFKNEES